MANDYDKFSAGTMDKGVDNFNPDFSAEISLDHNSYNVSSGIHRGIGPRYGIVSLPGHQHTEGNIATETVGLRGCEGTNGTYSYRQRQKVLGCFALTETFSNLLGGTTYDTPQRYYVWIVGNDTDGTNNSLSKIDVVISAFKTASGGTAYIYPSPNIASGINYSLSTTGGTAINADDNPYLRLNLPGTTAASVPSWVAPYFKNYSKYYISAAVISVAGKDVPCQWLVAKKLTDLGALTPGTFNFVRGVTGFGSTVVPYGSPSPIQIGNYKQTVRGIKTYNLYTHGTYGLSLAYSYHYDGLTVGASTYVRDPEYENTASQFVPGVNADARTGRTDTTAPAAVDVTGPILLNDPEMVNNTAYKAVLLAGKKPMAMLTQGWNRGLFGYPFQIIDLTQQRFKPLTAYTMNVFTPGNPYTEEGIRKHTCWLAWPEFAQATALTAAAANPRAAFAHSSTNTTVAMGAANSGVLRSNTTYEFTYSVYDKWLGYETNVGTPAKVRTGADDNARLAIYRDVFVGGSFRQTVASGDGAPVFRFLDKVARLFPMNQIEFRVYYRELGSYEWLPALFVDAAKYWHYPDYQDGLWACEAPIAALPGGQPGGFIDYSELPNDEYTCVFVYKNRAFWISPNNLVFSLKDNIFAYPLRNNTPAPTGGYRGATVHTYRGESEQESRLVIWGGKETYVGKFTGLMQKMPVVVSPDVIESYDVDGSDFLVEAWTSVTAFSHRSAVVADGDLYWWGQQGFYMDNGVGNPVPIGDHLKPDIFDAYDQSKTEEIFCSYNEKTKEIMWFYPPKTANTITYGVSYNTRTQQFQYHRFTYKIDWAQTIDTSNNQVTQDLGGLRTMIGARTTSAGTTQRAYYFDQFTRAGDHGPNTELMVKTVADSGSNKLLTLASGYDSTNFNTLAVGDFIAIQQFKRHTGQSTGDDILAKIASLGAGTITLTMPPGATLPNVTLSDWKTYFPIWHKAAAGNGLNGIPWQISSNYWMPSGINYHGIWRWLYMFFKYTTWYKVDPQTFSLGYRTPSGADFITDTITFRDNSDTNFQLYHALREGRLNNQGQAFKFKMSGAHLAEEWVLQYLEAHASDEEGNLLKQYQG